MNRRRRKITFKQIFISGLIAFIPVAITAYVVVLIFNLLDGFVRGAAYDLFGIYIPGIGIAFLLIIVVLLGLLVSNVVGRRMVSAFGKALLRIPFVKTIYKSINDIIRTFSNKSSEKFKDVVLIDLFRNGEKTIGFVSNSEVKVKGEKLVCVFVPTAPNPTIGHLVMVHEDKIDYLDLSVAEALNFVVAMGTVPPEQGFELKLKKTKKPLQPVK